MEKDVIKQILFVKFLKNTIFSKIQIQTKNLNVSKTQNASRFPENF